MNGRAPLRAAALALAALLSSLPAAARAADSFTAAVSARRVVTGDPFRVELRWSGEREPQGAPRLGRPDAAPAFGPQVQSQFSSFNGRATRSVSWTWVVVPETDGEIDFGTATLSAGGRTLSAAVPVVVAGPPPPQPFARVALSSDKPEVLVGESFRVRAEIELALPDAPDGAGPVSPLAPGHPPLLKLPFLDADADPGACTRDAAPADALSPLSVRADAPGFRVNSFSVATRRDPFAGMGFGGFGGGFPSLFGEETPAVFAPPHERFAENGTNFVRYAVEASFTASAEGRCRFAPARFEGQIVRSVAGDGRPTGVSRPIVAISRPLEVAVVPPPREGRPDSFFGALGTELRPLASLDAQTCRQGDPLALTLRLEGDLVPQTVRAPDVFAAPGMSDAFRAWGDVERKDDGGTPVFEYRVRALAAGTIEVPPIPLSYFDTAARSYVTVETAPVPLRVDPVADFDPAALFAAAATNSAALSLQAAASGPVAPSLSLDPAGALPRPAPGALAVLLASALPPALWLLAVLLPALPGALGRARGAVRRGGARGRAASRIRSAETPQQTLDAVRRLLRDRWGEDLPGLTPSDLDAALARHGAPEEERRRAVSLLQETFDEAFRPGADARAAVRSRRDALASALLAALRALPLLAALAATALPASAAVSDPVFLWRRAAAAAAKASSPEDFLAAARDYRELAEENGAPAAALYANLGATLLQAGCKAEALDAFARAEAVGGADAWTEAGTALASGGEPSWRRTLLAWHYRAPLALRRTALAAAWCALWLLLAAARFLRRGSRAALAGAALSAAVAAMLAASLAASARTLSAPMPPVPDAPPQENAR